MAVPFADHDPVTGEFVGLATSATQRAKVSTYVSKALDSLDRAASQFEMGRIHLAQMDLNVARDMISKAIKAAHA